MRKLRCLPVCGRQTEEEEEECSKHKFIDGVVCYPSRMSAWHHSDVHSRRPSEAWTTRRCRSVQRAAGRLPHALNLSFQCQKISPLRIWSRLREWRLPCLCLHPSPSELQLALAHHLSLRPCWFAEVLHIFCILTVYCWALAGSVSCAWFRFCYPAAGKQPCNLPRLSGPLNQSGGLEIPLKSWSTNLMEGSRGENRVLKVCLSAYVWLQRMERLTQSAEEDWWRQAKGWWTFIVDHHFIWLTLTLKSTKTLIKIESFKDSPKQIRWRIFIILYILYNDYNE